MALIGAAAALVHCGGAGSDSCAVGASVACTCTDGAQGAQTCLENQTLGTCVCSGSSSSGSGSGGSTTVTPGWTQDSAPEGPSARNFPAAVYDSNREVTVVFGGCNGDDGETFLNDTWEWDGSTWSQKSPAQSPSARGSAAMAFDSKRGVTVLFGGCTSVISGTGTCTGEPTDTWEWDGTNWTQQSPSNSPPGRTASANMVFDVARGVSVLFGGYGAGDLNDTWLWDGSDWTRASASAAPSVRCNSRMAYDLAHSVTVLFGGAPCGGPDMSDTWEWNGTDWTEQSPDSSPSARDGHAMAYDAKGGVIVLFAGNTPSGLLDDTWQWDGTTWTQGSGGSSPVARAGHAMAFDSKHGVSVLFGGTSVSSWPNSSYLGDTWQYSP